MTIAIIKILGALIALIGCGYIWAKMGRIEAWAGIAIVIGSVLIGGAIFVYADELASLV